MLCQSSFRLLLTLLGLLKVIIKTAHAVGLFKVFLEVDLDVFNVLADEEHVVGGRNVFTLAIVHH